MRYVLALMLFGCGDDPHELVTCNAAWGIDTCEAACAAPPAADTGPSNCIRPPGAPPGQSASSFCPVSNYREFDGVRGCCEVFKEAFDDGPERIGWFECLTPP